MPPMNRAGRPFLPLAVLAFLDEVKGKLLFGETVSQAMQVAESRNSQAAFLPLSWASPPLERDGPFVRRPPEAYLPIERAGAVLSGTLMPRIARARVAFLLGPEVRAIPRRHGFGRPPGH